MRLKENIKYKIIKLSKHYFGNNSKVYLFGSRTKEHLKGGDIDLLIESEENIEYDMQINFLSDMYKNITQRKVDLLIKTPFVKNKPIFKMIQSERILLC